LLLLRSQRPSHRKLPTGRVKTDRQRGGLVMAKMFFSRADVLEQLALLSSSAPDIPEGQALHSITVQLTKDELAKLKHAVAAAGPGVTVPILVRRCLRATGVI